MPGLDVLATTLNHHAAGDGPPLVLAQGSGTDLTT
jgi:hypothetical protein